MLHKFPKNITLRIISDLPLQSLYAVALVSRRWRNLIRRNEPVVYRNAAILHRFIDENQLVGGADTIIADWKAYCRRQLEIERGWRGKVPPVVDELFSMGPMVHRVKVDYELDFILTTSQWGGLSVCDIKTDRVLWALPPDHVVEFAHLEYDRGYIVVNRHDNCKEVWRSTMDADGTKHAATSLPDKKMQNASKQAAEKFNPAGNRSRRGHFQAWALLRMPEECRWFRLSYPNLLAVATNNAYVWDIQTSELGLVIRDVQRRHQGLQLGTTCYAEVSNRHVFICGEGGLRIFAKEGGALLYQLSPRELSGATWDVRPQSRGLLMSILCPQMLRYNKHSPSSLHGKFVACHVSASGNDLAVLTTNGRLVLLPGFQRLFAKPKATSHQNIAVIVNFQQLPTDEDISYYLAVGSRNGKLAVATQRGIYVVSPDMDFTRLTAERPSQPGVFVCRVSKYGNERFLPHLSCLQIAHDAIYIAYQVSIRELPDGANTVHSVSF